MNSMLYSDRIIKTKYFLISNLKSKEKYGGFVRLQEYGCSNYFGEEIKNPIYETQIKPLNTITKRTIRPINLFNLKKKLPNKSVKLKENFKLVLNPKKSKGFQAKEKRNLSTNKKINLKLIKLNFPYCKPSVNNSYTELILYNKNKDYIIAKNIEKNKKKM